MSQMNGSQELFWADIKPVTSAKIYPFLIITFCPALALEKSLISLLDFFFLICICLFGWLVFKWWLNKLYSRGENEFITLFLWPRNTHTSIKWLHYILKYRMPISCNILLLMKSQCLRFFQEKFNLVVSNILPSAKQ